MDHPDIIWTNPLPHPGLYGSERVNTIMDVDGFVLTVLWPGIGQIPFYTT